MNNLASYLNRTIVRTNANRASFIQKNRDDPTTLEGLVDKFRSAHMKLNEIELALQDGMYSPQRSELLHNLENARGDYMDARFALASRQQLAG